MLDVLKHFRRGLNSDRPLELKNYWFTFSMEEDVVFKLKNGRLNKTFLHGFAKMLGMSLSLLSGRNQYCFTLMKLLRIYLGLFGLLIFV